MNDTTMRFAKEVEYFSRLSYERFLVRAAGGNLSVRLPGNQGFLITPTAVSLRDITAEGLIVVDQAGKKISGPDYANPSKEVNLHLVVYANRPEVQAVVHLHPAYSIAFTTQNGHFPLVTSQARIKLGPVPIAPWAKPGSDDLVKLIEKELKNPEFDGKAILLQEHGLITWDINLSLAFDSTELVEETAIVATVIKNIGSSGSIVAGREK
jgi:L-fuculose-phosphate aldolase